MSKKDNVHILSSSLPHSDKCHGTSRIFKRTEQTYVNATSFGVIFYPSFWRKNGYFGFERTPSASKKALSKGTFFAKMNALNDTKTSELSKYVEETGKICDLLRHL